MKKTGLLILALALAGCNSDTGEDHDTSKTVSEKKQVSEQTLASSKIPNGKWLYNPLYCSGELPIIGPYDFSVEQETITHIGIKDKGAWYVSKNKIAEEAFKAFIEENESCLKLESGDIEVISFKGVASEYTLGLVNPKVMLRYNSEKVELIRPFDIEEIKKLKIVDNSEGEEL